jgi:succinyl-CoA synthetase beta subunit
MDLLEYQGKQLFARHGVPVPSGEPATTVDEAVAAADRIGYPCVVKAQVQIGGRGKAGGIKVAKDQAEAPTHAEAISAWTSGLHGPRAVDRGRVADRVEYYASGGLRPRRQGAFVMLSTQGGMDIEAGAEETPERSRPCTSTAASGSRRSTAGAWPTRRDPADLVRPVGASSSSCSTCSSPRRRCSWRSTRSS